MNPHQIFPWLMLACVALLALLILVPPLLLLLETWLKVRRQKRFGLEGPKLFIDGVSLDLVGESALQLESDETPFGWRFQGRVRIDSEWKSWGFLQAHKILAWNGDVTFAPSNDVLLHGTGRIGSVQFVMSTTHPRHGYADFVIHGEGKLELA